jgi:soluble lytic murein transglycosylase-like protein
MTGIVSLQAELTLAQVQMSLVRRIVERLGQLSEAPEQKTGYTPLSGQACDRFDDLIEEAAQKYEMPADLVKAVVRAESNFDPSAVSVCGAKGLMQLMDGTAADLGVTDSLDPTQNIEGGVAYLRQMLDRYGQIPLALAAYNAGPGAVDRYDGVPPYAETQTYVRRVLGFASENKWEA